MQARLSIEQLYPYVITLKHQGHKFPVSLGVVNWLESQLIMNIVDFHLEMNTSPERISLRFKNKTQSILFKKSKKSLRSLLISGEHQDKAVEDNVQ